MDTTGESNTAGGGGGEVVIKRHPCFKICENQGLASDITCAACSSDKAKGAHGIAFERYVCRMITREIASEDGKGVTYADKLFANWVVESKKNNTAIHDITPELMLLKKWPDIITIKYGHGVSVKYMKDRCDICCADMERIYNNFTDDWSQVVGFYIKKTTPRPCWCTQRVYFLKFKDKEADRRLLFGTAKAAPPPNNDFQNVTQALKIAKKNHPLGGSGGVGTITSVADATRVRVALAALQGKLCDGGFGASSKSKPVLRIRPKLDSSAARLQCAYNFKLFLKLIAYYAEKGQAWLLPDSGEYAILYTPIISKTDKYYKSFKGGKRRKTRRRKRKRTNRRRGRRTRRSRRNRRRRRRRTRRMRH